MPCSHVGRIKCKIPFRLFKVSPSSSRMWFILCTKRKHQTPPSTLLSHQLSANVEKHHHSRRRRKEKIQTSTAVFRTNVGFVERRKKCKWNSRNESDRDYHYFSTPSTWTEKRAHKRLMADFLPGFFHHLRVNNLPTPGLVIFADNLFATSTRWLFK